MANADQTVTRWLAVLVLCLCLACGFTATQAASQQFSQDCQALMQGDHRLTGTPEYAAAVDHLVKRLRALGLQPIEQTFPSAQMVTKRCALVMGSRTLPLLPMRPNGIIPPVTPPEGITGSLLYAGKGELEDYGTQNPQGKIVVLDYNAGANWLQAFRLGAQAVIFVRNGSEYSWQPHFTEASANFPRYYYAGNRNDLVNGRTGTLHCEVTWQPVTGCNIVALLPGTKPVFDKSMGNEVIVLAANLDSYGEVPTRSPGARGAANCASLLKIAEQLQQNPTRRDVLLVFFDGQSHGHAGASAFYSIFATKPQQVRLESRKTTLNWEKQRVSELLAALNGQRAKRRTRDDVINRMKTKAAEHVFAINADMEDLRKVETALKIQLRGKAGADVTQPVDTQAVQDQLADVQAQLAKDQQEKDQWNDLRRALSQSFESAGTGALKPVYDITVEEVRADIALRQREMRAKTVALNADQQIFKLLGKSWISLHISLLLGDASPRWGVLVGGDSALHNINDQPGLYGKIQGTFGEMAEKLQASGTPVAHFEKATTDGSLSSKLFWPNPLIHSGEIPGRFSIFNLALGTIQEKLPREGTPDDTLKTLNLDRVEEQAAEIATLLRQVGNSDGLSLRRTITEDAFYTYVEPNSGSLQGPTVMGISLGSSMPNKPMPGAVVQMAFKPVANFTYQPTQKIPGFDQFQVLMTDANAMYTFGPAPTDTYNAMLRGFAVVFDKRGQVESASDVSSTKTVTTRLNTFLCALNAVQGTKRIKTNRTGAVVMSPQLDTLEARVLQARSQSALDPAKTFFATTDGVIYWYCERRVEDVQYFGLQAAVALVNGPETSGFDQSVNVQAMTQKVRKQVNGQWKIVTERLTDQDLQRIAQGTGYTLMSSWWEYPTSSLRSAADLWRLNESRLNVLRARGVINSSIEELHWRANDLLDNAYATENVAKRDALATSSFLAQRPVYETVRRSLDDLVRAVLLLLALAIPFAFALERLVIGATNIYRQISWFCVFFLATFVILYLVHPAFAISGQPIIIFLAFALMTLSSLVIYVIMQKFEEQLKIIQGLTSTVHTADVSRFNTMMAAVGMGISTMRRRPLRTALTALTITLLTFTILNFASFDTKTGIVTLFPAPTPNYTGVLMHRVNWAPLDPSVLGILQGRWQDDSALTARYWLPAGADPASAQAPLISLADGSKPTPLKGVLGLDPREITYRKDLRTMLGPNANQLADGIFMTEALASSMGVKPGDAVVIGGLPLRVAGLLDPAVETNTKDMDETGILPVDFSAMTSSQSGIPAQLQQQQQRPTGADVLAAAQNKQDWVVLPADTVVVVSAENARLMGGTLRVITLYTKDAQTATSIAEDAARIFPLPVTATRPDGVYTHVLAPTVMAKGLKDLIFPILLGGLVIFGTMLGSVADREREIYTFSALGLAPTHVATLFFAEAMVYSFIGGMGGYLLAQAVMKVMTLLANLGVLSTLPEMNYSSMNAIVTILIVMCTVMVSAIYPAIKASRSANPGVLRTWRLPAPDGDNFHIVFPFTVSQYDITGVMSFLKEHFDNFTDTSLGVFMSRDTRITRRDDGSLALNSLLALAPFDLGVTQDFELFSTPSEIDGIDEVKIELVRRSGQHKDWARLNKVLLDDLRRQFLIWRSLPQETMEDYRQRTLTTLGEAETGEVAPTPKMPQMA